MKYMNNHYGQSQIFGHARFKMPMNIQLFAESSGGDGGSGEGDESEEAEVKNDGTSPSVDELASKLKHMEVLYAQTKSALDKQMKKNGELTKQNRAGMSETQLEIQSLKDQNEEIVNQNKELMEQNKKLVENDRISRYTKSFMSCAMDEKTADSFAQSIEELKDEPKFFATFKKYAENLAKSSGENAIQDLIKKNPEIKAGTGDDTKSALADERAISIGKKTSGANEDILKHYRR